MKTVKFAGTVILFIAMVSLFASPVHSDQVNEKAAATEGSNNQSLTDQIKSIDEQVNPAAWNIRNGCVVLRRIKRIKFVDDQTALMSMRGKNKGRNKIVLKLRRECPGIKRNGYVHRTSGLRLCAGFDRFSVMGSSFSCRVESLEPYVNIEEPQEKISLD